MNTPLTNPLLSRGMCNAAFFAYALAFQRAGIDFTNRPDFWAVQCEGHAKASAGFHESDGTLDGHSYTVAVDVHASGVSRTLTATLLDELCGVGFVTFFRNWTGNVHSHCNYAGAPQKGQLDRQNADFFAGRDGLVGHRRIDDEWWYPELKLREIPRALFAQSNPATGKGVVVMTPEVIAFRYGTVPKTPALPTPHVALYLGKETRSPFDMLLIKGVAYAPVRKFGLALGFDVNYDKASDVVTYDGEDVPIARKLIDGSAYAPIRQLAREVGLSVLSADIAGNRVVVGHAA